MVPALVDAAQHIPQTPGIAFLGSIFTPSKIFWHVELTLLARLGISLFLGSLIGFVHSWRYKDHIGFRTYGSVATGAAAFSGLATFLYLATGQGAALTIIDGIIVSIGFLCGAILFRNTGEIVRGLSTAVTVWATAAIGVACGVGLTGVALAATLALLLFQLLPKRIIKDAPPEE